MVFYIVICFWSCNVSFIICEFISGMIKYFVVKKKKLETFSISVSSNIQKSERRGKNNPMAISSTKTGKEQIVEKLLIENYEQYYRLAYSYVHNEADALDIVQEGAYKAI